MGLRRKARELALQTLYALDFNEREPFLQEIALLENYPGILAQIADDAGMKPEDQARIFADDLIRNTILRMHDLDEFIVKFCKNWTIERLASIDRNILRMAAFEMLHTDTAPAVIINEAIEIAKKYSTENSGKFVNGVLDAIHASLKAEKQD